MTEPHYTDGSVTLYLGDCLDVLRELADASVDAVVTDPPYGISFMGKQWDQPGKHGSKRRGGSDRPFTAGPVGVDNRTTTERSASMHAGKYDLSLSANQSFGAWCEEWATQCLRVLKPGGHLLAFGGTRTSHRLACAIEDAGFEIRDSIAWLYGQGFPKSLNVSAALDAARCRCEVGEWPYGKGESATQHGLRDVPDADVPETEGTARGPRTLLLPSVSKQGTPTAGRSQLRTTSGGVRESGVEGRGHPQAGEGQLQGRPIHALPAEVLTDGADGRVHHGAPSSDGSVDRSLPTANGSGEPQGPQPVEQPTVEPGALPVERGPQAWGGWPVCGRCSQPVIPDGLGTAAKPAHEPIVVARKPLSGTVAATVLAHGTGALNIDACRIGRRGGDRTEYGLSNGAEAGIGYHGLDGRTPYDGSAGRWPANVVLDVDQAAALDTQSGETTSGAKSHEAGDRVSGDWRGMEGRPGSPRRGSAGMWESNSGGASRFFYTAKASADERVRLDGTAHPTVKPLSLMRWLVRLVTPPGGVVLEPFAGSGTTVEACILEGFNCVAIERETDYLPLIVQRINRRRNPVAAVKATGDDGGLFDLIEGEPA